MTCTDNTSTATSAAIEGQWLCAVDWLRFTRHGILLRLLGNPHVIEEEKNLLRESADDLTLIIQYIENNKRGERVSASFPKKHKEAIDKLMVKLANIQVRLGQKTWEV